MKNKNLPNLEECIIAIIGMGYVGLPLAVEFGKKKKCLLNNSNLDRKVICFDIDNTRLEELKKGFDRTNETHKYELKESVNLFFTNDPRHLIEAEVFIVTVPTPIDSSKKPDLDPLLSASKTVGKALQKRSENFNSNLKPIIIYESTVYPGATEDICVPIIEEYSKLIFNKDFFCAYSPERINPGDNLHKLTNIVKVTSGSTKESSEWVDKFYGSIIKAGTFNAKSIKVAESAKVIENTQRDLNIALINELTIIFKKLNIDTLDVLEAAKTKWNFLDFNPGLVGGHCIGVDPYYLTYIAEKMGYYPELVLAGRRINDNMSNWIVEQLILEMAKAGKKIKFSKVLILGLAFKANCPDMRNTKVIDLINNLKLFSVNTCICDPWVNDVEAKRKYDINVLKNLPNNKKFDAIICAVEHKQFKNIDSERWRKILNDDGIIFDLKGLMPRDLNPVRV